MAKLWAVKDGARPDNQEGEALEVTVAEFVEVFKDFVPRWVGTDAPSITPQGKPSKWARYTVIEIEASDGVSREFPKPGYYFVDGLDPHHAETEIGKHRA